MPVYSYSRINTYDNCPRQYKFKYIDRIKPPFELKTIEAFMGSCIHSALNDFYQQLIYQRIPDKKDLIACYETYWKEKWTDDIVIMKTPLDPNHYKSTGEKALSNYYERYPPFDQAQTIGLEKMLTFKIGPYSFKGYIDRLSRDKADTYEIHDYKTSGSMPSFPEAEKDLQLAMYQISVQKHYPDVKRVRSIWHYLLFDQSWEVELDAEQLALKETMIAQKVFDLEHDLIFEPQPSGLCNWCTFQDICPAKTHERKLDQEDDREENEGYRLVSKYGYICSKYKKARSELESIKSEKEQMENTLHEYAKANEYKVMEGKYGGIQVKDKISYRFPDSKDPARPALEELIQKNGLWMEASILHSSKLNKMIKNAKVDEEIRNELLGFSSMEIKTSFKWINLDKNLEEEKDDSIDNDES